MFENELRAGDSCAVELQRGAVPDRGSVLSPRRFQARGRRWEVGAVEAHWREWRVDSGDARLVLAEAYDVEVWRVRTCGPDVLVVELVRDLARGSWSIRSVWD